MKTFGGLFFLGCFVKNHLIKVPKIKDYSPPKKEDPRPALPSKKRLEILSTEDETSDEEDSSETTERIGSDEDEEMES